MLKLISLTLLLTTLACQSTGSSGKRRNGLPDKSPGPIVEPTSVDGVKAGPGTETGTVEPTAPVTGSTPGTYPVESGDPEIFAVATPVYLGEADPSQNKNLPYGMLTLKSSAENWIISRPQYVLSWNRKTRNINWVAWTMTLEDVAGTGRQPTFVIDPVLKEYGAGTDVKPVTTADYSDSCYDRGHQVASSDRQATPADNAATFFTTNIIPQSSFLNQIIWRKLEAEIEGWLLKSTHKHLWVVAGPIYDKNLSYMGPEESIAVPKANFKAVFSWEEQSKDKPFLVKAVIMPNVLSNGSAPASDRDRRCAEQDNGGRFKIGTMPNGKAINETPISEDVDDYKATLPAIEAAARIKFPAVIQP